MIPILFAPGTTSFTTNGIGRLIEATSCVVKEALNGIYELEMQYPVTGMWFNEIKHSCIIYALNYDGGSEQAFRIYEITVPIKGVITIYAEHISYQTNWIPVEAFEASSLQDCLDKLKSKSAENNPFTFSTDKWVVSPISFLQPKSLRKMLGGEEGSILQTYKGEYVWDNYNIRLLNKRGSDNGVTLRYGKNITTIEQDTNIENTYTGVYPYWYDEEAGVLVTLPEKTIHSSQASNFPYQRTAVVDFSDKFDEQPTIEQLRNITNTYIEQNNIGHPNVSIDVEFVQLWQSNEYKDIQPLEYVKLGDTVTVIFETLGIEEKSEVIEYEFDVLKERYNSVKIGDPKSTLANTIAEVASEIEITREESKEYAAKATYWLTKGDGYLYIVKGSDGTWRELIAMDTPNKDTAKKVLRINQYGIGFSDSGVNGEFYQAWTLDGRLTLGGINNSYGEFELLDTKGNVIGRLNKDGIYFGSTGSALQMDGTTTEVDTGESKAITIDTNGFRIYNPTRNNNYIIASYDSTGITLYNPNGRNRDTDILATYKTNGITFYKNGKTVAEFNEEGIKTYENGYLSLSITSSGISFYSRNKQLMRIYNNGIQMWDNSGNLLANYTGDGFALYRRGTAMVTANQNGIQLSGSNGKTMANLTPDSITFWNSKPHLTFELGSDGAYVYNPTYGNRILSVSGSGIYVSTTISGTSYAAASIHGDGMNIYGGWTKLNTGTYYSKNNFEISDSGLKLDIYQTATDQDSGTQYRAQKMYLYYNQNGISSYYKGSTASSAATFTNFGSNGISIRAITSGSYGRYFTFDSTGLQYDELVSAIEEKHMYLNYGNIKAVNNNVTLFELSQGIIRTQSNNDAIFEANANTLALTLRNKSNEYLSMNYAEGFKISKSKASMILSESSFQMSTTSGSTTNSFSITPASGFYMFNNTSSTNTSVAIGQSSIESTVVKKSDSSSYKPYSISAGLIEVADANNSRVTLSSKSGQIGVYHKGGGTAFIDADSASIQLQKSNKDALSVSYDKGIYISNSTETKEVQVALDQIFVTNNGKGVVLNSNGTISLNGGIGVSGPDNQTSSKGWKTFDVIGGIDAEDLENFKYDPVYTLAFYNGILVYWDEK